MITTNGIAQPRDPITPAVMSMYFSWMLLTTRSSLGILVAEADDTLTFDELVARLQKDEDYAIYTPEFLAENQDIIESYLGPGKQEYREALKELQLEFKPKADARALIWTDEPCPKGFELAMTAKRFLG